LDGVAETGKPLAKLRRQSSITSQIEPTELNSRNGRILGRLAASRQR
jgi:hypothetical protein